MFRFYNGGNADDLTLAYTVDNRNAYHHIRIEAKSFFEVPEMKTLPGNKKVFTNFDQTVPTRKGQFGVIRVDPDADEAPFTGVIARTDEEARKIGDERHRDYLIQLVQDYTNHVEKLRAQGMTALPAQGYTRYALKALNVEDPAESVRNLVNKAEESKEIKALRKQVEELAAKLAKP